MAKPVFLVGWRRSGTTWLGSLISRNPRVASVLGGVPGQGGGCVESYFFSHLDGKFGDLRKPSNLIQLIEIFGSGTYYELAGLGKEFLYKARPTDYATFFRLVMDRLAELRGASHWLEKNPTHSFHVADIARYYPDALFINIERQVVDQVRSALKINELEGVDQRGWRMKAMIVKEVVAFHMSHKHIARFRARLPDRMLTVRYEDLVRTREEVMRKICQFLGLEYQPEMLELIYREATGFRSVEERQRMLSPGDVSLIRVLDRVCRFVPYFVYRGMYVLKRRAHGRHLPIWFFSSEMDRHGWTDVADAGRTQDLPAARPPEVAKP